MTYFDESRLDDERALGSVDLRLRTLAESGSRVRRETGDAADAIEAAVAQGRESRPRAVIAAGPDSRLLRAVLEPVCPVPFVAWPGAALPGWAGSLDLVVVLAPGGGDQQTASAVAEAIRRGCQVVVATPPRSLVAEHTEGRYATLLPATTEDQLASAVVMLTYLHRVGLGPAAEADEIASALDTVATDCSPHRDIAVNSAKVHAIALADALPLVWGGSVLAARAARRIAESIRRTSGRSALAGEVDQLLPVIEQTAPRNVFDDPFDGSAPDLRPVLVVLDDPGVEPMAAAAGKRLRDAADERGVRVQVLTTDAASDVGRYASLMLLGTYAAEYLRLGLNY